VRAQHRSRIEHRAWRLADGDHGRAIARGPGPRNPPRAAVTAGLVVIEQVSGGCMRHPRDVVLHHAGLRLHLLDWGQASAPPLLLLHGGAQTAHSFDEVAPDLCRDHHVLALDQRGHGDSDWAARYDREAFSADIAAVLDAHGWEAATLIALSLGGLNAIAFAASHP